MATTSLIIGETPKGISTISKIIEDTRIFSRVLHSTNAKEAATRLKNHPVDAIFYDAERLSRKAIVWSKLLNKQVKWCDIPVILFTEENNEDIKIAGLEWGASDCVTYNTSTKEVAARIRRILKNKKDVENLRRAKDELAQQAMTDPLTGLCNRRMFQMVMESEASRSNRTKEPFSLMMVDIDHFKKINDTFGHMVGDMILQTIASTLKNNIRKFDMVCRYGGEEFAIIMPGTDAISAYLTAERIRRRVTSLNSRQLPVDTAVSVSIGISTAKEPEIINTAKVIDEADQALYMAKRNGRNCTEIFIPAREELNTKNYANDFTSPPLAQFA